jgi:hypothetical protein
MPEFENNSEYYYEKLKDSDKPGAVISAFYCALYNVSPSRTLVTMCNKLLKIFGRFTVFFALIDMAGSYPEVENPYALWYTICKRKFEAAHGDVFSRSHESLDPFLSSLDKELAQLKRRKKELDIPSSEGLA